MTQSISRRCCALAAVVLLGGAPTLPAQATAIDPASPLPTAPGELVLPTSFFLPPPELLIGGLVYPMAPDGPAFTIEVPRFDPALGTLTSVELRLASEVFVGFGLETPPGTFTEIAPALTSILARANGSEILSGSSDPRVRGAGGDFAWSETFNTLAAAILTEAADLALFTGTGTLALLHSASFVDPVISGPGAPQGGGQGAGSATAFITVLDVTYRFDEAVVAVSEPGALALAAVGLASLLGWRRRRPH